MNHEKALQEQTRRHFFNRCGVGVGSIALANLLSDSTYGTTSEISTDPLSPKPTHFPARAKRVIYLFQSGAPSQLELFDYKPKLEAMWGQELPESIRKGQRLTGMTAGQSRFPLAASNFKFAQYGQSRAWVSELLPYTAKITDELCYIKTMNTEAINHDPAVTFIQTGSQQAGRPSFGSWVSYGLGSDNQNMPTFVVLLAVGL